MFTNHLWISNDYRKIKNPTRHYGTTQKYQGILNPDFDFKYQTDNFIKIKTSLEQFGIFPTEIYYALRANKPIFLVCFDNPNIFWQKYEGTTIGSGQNYIYIGPYKINTTVWIELTPDKILQILNGIDPNKLSNGYIANNDLDQEDLDQDANQDN